MPLERFADRTAIVTGAASGIGRATLARLVAEGAQVVATDVVADPLDESVAAANEGACAGGRAVARVADVSSEDDVVTTVEAAVEELGHLDVLCNIAGILRTSHSHQLALAEWDRILAVNLTGTFLMCREALPHLLETKGCIVNTASTSSEFGHPYMAAYAASKGGVLALTTTLAVEYAKQGVRVNAVMPGSVRSGITRGFELPEDADGNLLYRIMSPTGAGEPESVASVVALLASDDGAHMTGAAVRIDGGTHA